MDQANDTRTDVEDIPHLAQAVSEARTMAREQVQAAWQLHLERVREQFETGWREALDHIYAERFSEIEHRLREGYEATLAERARQMAEQLLVSGRAAVRRETMEKLNNLARRLRTASSREEARHALIDAAREWSPVVLLLDAAELDLNTAPAFANAIESKDTVVAAATPGELSDSVMGKLQASGDARAYLVPVVARDKTVAVLCALASDGPLEVSSLELLASLAAPHLEVPPEPARMEPPPQKPSWSDLSRPDQELHLRAQRYARTRIAELVLHHIHRVRDARAASNLYGMFRNEIEFARNEFRREFFDASPTMVDYLHVELIRTLARDHAEALGPEYPGPLV